MTQLGRRAVWLRDLQTLGTRAAMLGLSLLAVGGCSRAAPPRKPPLFVDSFDRVELGADWRVTAPPGVYRLEDGHVVAHRAHNHPAWLQRELPRDAVIELDAWSADRDGDIKVEAWGDGRSYATDLDYTSSGYVFIQGGWNNRYTVLCRMEEHGHDRRTRSDLPVVPEQRYHWLIARHGSRIEWYIDGRLALDFDDAQPLEGPDHRYFAFDDWETRLQFDNLVVRPY